MHHVVIEVGPALGASQFLPGQLIITLALLDLGCDVLSVSFHDLNRRGRVHNPTLGGEFRIALEGQSRRLGRRNVSKNEEQKARAQEDPMHVPLHANILPQRDSSRIGAAPNHSLDTWIGYDL